MKARSACASRVTGVCKAMPNSNSLPPMQSASESPSQTSHVHPLLQSDRRHSPASLGDHLPLNSLRDSFLLQLLAGFSPSSHRPRLDIRQLSRTRSQPDLSSSALPFDAYRRRRHDPRSSARLSTRLLPLVLRGAPKRFVLSASHHSALGQLSRPRLRLEDDSRQRWCPQRILGISAHHFASG